MKRVEVAMNASFRGFISQFADEKGLTMPQAYRELLELGLFVCDVEIDNFQPTADVDEDVETVITLDDDDYEIILVEEYR